MLSWVSRNRHSLAVCGAVLLLSIKIGWAQDVPAAGNANGLTRAEIFEKFQSQSEQYPNLEFQIGGYLGAMMPQPCSIRLLQAQPKANTKSRTMAPPDADRFKTRYAQMPAPPCDLTSAALTPGSRPESATPAVP